MVQSFCYSVPQPRVEVTTLHSSTPLYAGSSLTLRCTIEVDASVDIPYTIAVRWSKSGAGIGNNARVTVSNITQLSSLSYESRLNFNPLSSTLDAGTYVCHVEVSPESSLLLVRRASQTDAEAITVQGTNLSIIWLAS